MLSPFAPKNTCASNPLLNFLTMWIDPVRCIPRSDVAATAPKKTVATTQTHTHTQPVRLASTSRPVLH